MTNVVIKPFDSNQLEQLAKNQTEIYNQATKDLSDYFPAKVEDVVKRFQRTEFDPKRMYYAFDGPKMIGYAGLTGRDQRNNLRTVGYPWLLKDTPANIRDQLYDAMESQCKSEGTKSIRFFASERYPDMLKFFKSKNFNVTQEFYILNKQLAKQDYKLPEGYTFRQLKEDDLSNLENVSKNDPKMKEPFNASDWKRFMGSSDYNPDNVVVAEKDGKVVGFYSLFIPKEPDQTKCYFGGVTVHGEHQAIEQFLLIELMNRAFNRGKKTLETAFYPDSKRLPPAKEMGFKQVSTNYKLEKML